MDDPTAELVRRTQRGDHAAFASLYDRHAKLVRAICFDATGDAAAAEDLAQDVFLRAYQRIAQLRDPRRFVAWLCEIARRAGRDWRRRPRRERTGELDVLPVPDVTRQPADDRVTELQQAIRALPAQERLALHLFYLQQQPAEVARHVLGLSPAGFYKLLERARTRAGQIMVRNQEALR